MPIVINGTTYNRAMQNVKKVSVLFNSNKVIDSFPNLLVNSGFETGDLTSWAGDSWSIDSSASRSGSHSLTTTGNTELINTTEITAVKGHTLRFSFYAKSNGTTAGFYKRLFGWNGSSWEWVIINDDKWDALGSDWTLQSFDYTCDGTYPKLRFRTVPYNPDSNTLWVDDASVNDVSLPFITEWTGTPNASTSTLSQDGQVIATNVAEDPAITRTLAAYSSEGTWVRSPDATSPSGFSWTFTAQQNNWQWLGDLRLIGLNGVVSNPHPGEKMHVLLYAGNTMLKSIGISVNVYNGTSWKGQPNAVTIAPGPMSWSDTTFTMPVDPSILVRLNSLSGIGSTGTVTIGAVMLLTDTDWQAMQARGVTWFDGTTYTRSNN